MKKNSFLLILLFGSATLFSQVGINTENPKTTLDVVASPSDLTKVDGIMAPRLTGEELKAKDGLYTETTTSVEGQTGAIVYVTEGLDVADTTTKTVNVTTSGYYYFDGSVWVKIGGGGSATPYQEPWFDQATNTEATLNTQNIYTMGNVGVKTDEVPANVSLETKTDLDYGLALRTSGTDGYVDFRHNIISANDFSHVGDIGILFSTDDDFGTDANNGMYIMPYRSISSGEPFGMKIMENGKVGISAKEPSETLDVGTGNVRVRDINTNTSTNPTDKYVVADADGVLKVTNLFVPKTSLVGTRTTATANITAGTTTTVLFTANPLLSGFTYNATTGIYTAENAGYYQISTTVVKDYSMNNPTDGTSFLTLRVNGANVSFINTGYLNGSQGSSQNLTYAVYLNAGDNFSITTSYTRVSRITNAQVSVIALGG